MSKIHEVNAIGQSFWLDELSRVVLKEDLPSLIDEGVSGLTSNPSIFEKAIESGDYDGDIATLGSLPPETAYRQLLFQDITAACDILLTVFKGTDGKDGYVSVELPPKFAHDPEKTTFEALRWAEAVGRENLMIKIPGTSEGLEAIRLLTGVGININVTLLFSPDQYERAAHAYIAGLESLHKRGRSLNDVHSVASFFVSRIDTRVDAEIDRLAPEHPDLKELRGTAALAVSRIAYSKFQNAFNSAGFKRLREEGANVQRLLFGSTSTKDPSFSPVKYIDGLIGKDTVNTLPSGSIRKFLEIGEAAETLTEQQNNEAISILDRLDKAGIDLSTIFQLLEDEGVELFDRAYWSVVGAIEGRK